MARHLGTPQPRTIFPIRPRRSQKAGGGFVFSPAFAAIPSGAVRLTRPPLAGARGRAQDHSVSAYLTLKSGVVTNQRVCSRTPAPRRRRANCVCFFGNNRPLAVLRAAMLEFVIFKRRRNFCWQVRDQTGKMVATGRESSRPAARYRAYRALFLVLSTGWKATDLQPS